MEKTSHFSDKYHRPYLMGVSIIIVFLFHIWSFALRYHNVEIPIMGSFFGCGYFGVDIFFFLSTYGLSYSINNNTLKQFYKNRFSRIIPAYIVFLIFFCICFSVFYKNNWLVVIGYFLSSISGLAVINEFPQVEWYTPSLILIYAFFPIINAISKWLANKNCLVISLLLIGLHVVLYHTSLPIYSNFYQRIPIIFLGCIYFYLERKNENCGIYVLSLLGLFGSCFAYGCIDRVAIAIPAILYIIGKCNTLPFYKAISYCGKWSFEIYLAQVVSTKYFMKIYNGNILLEVVCVILITIALSFVFSSVTHYYKVLMKSK